jgi:hypothetical protein
MKMKVTLGVFSLLVLGSAAVLANSSQPLFELVKFAASYHLAAINPAVTEIRSERSDTAKVEKLEQRFPDHILYDLYFRICSSTRKQAQSLDASDAKAAGLASFCENRANLTQEEGEAFRRVVDQFNDETATLDSRAVSAIKRLRKGKTSDPDSLNAMPPEIADLQNQRDALALKYRDVLQVEIGGDGFAKIDSYIRTDFAEGIKATPVASVDFTQNQ